MRLYQAKAEAFYRLSSCRIEQSLGVSIRAHDRISDQLSLIIGMMTPSQSSQDPALDLRRRSIGVGSPRVDSNSNQAQMGKIVTHADSPRLSEENLGHQLEVVQNSSPMVVKQQCQALCSCTCHVSTVVKSPWILESIIGKIRVQYVGRRPHFNEAQCRRSAESSFNMVYQLPKYIMSRYISMTMQYAPLSGPEFLLRMPRTASWSHLLWNYAHNGDLLAIQKLFAEGKASPYDLNPQGSNALLYASHNPRLSQFLLDQGADPNHPNNLGRTSSESLWEYSFAGRFGNEGISVVGSMLKDTSHMQTQGFSTLHKIILGIASKDLESELKTSTARINVGDSKNRTPLWWAVIRSDLQAVKTLLVFGANPNILDNWGHSPLDIVRNIDICKLLLDSGVNIYARNKEYGRSALHQLFKGTSEYSVDSDTVDLIDVLVDAGINVDVRDNDGETPLLNAIFSGHISHAHRLIELGANVNATNLSSRESAIHFAVLFDRHEIIPLLLERGADYTAVNASGNNIAHMAAWSAGTNTVSVLAKSSLVNLDVSLRSKNGKTPADYLSERSVLIESEQGLHAEFERFMKSVQVSKAGTAGGNWRPANADEGSDALSNLHLPGAYPVFADPSVSF